MLPAVHTKVEKVWLPPPVLRLGGPLHKSNDLMMERPKMLTFCKGEHNYSTKSKFKKAKGRLYPMYDSNRISSIYLQHLI